MPGGNCSIFNCYSSRAAPAILFFRIPAKNTLKLNWRKSIVSVITRVDGDLKRQIENRTLHTSGLFLLAKIFSIGQKLLAQTHRVGNKSHYAGLYVKRANASLFLIRDTLPTLNSTNPQSSR